MDASKPLLEEVFLKKFSNEKSSSYLISIKVSYQWKPKQCSICQVFGHSDQACPIKIGFPGVSGPGQNDGSSAELPVGAVAGKTHSGAPTPSVWRVVSKKGKARVMTEQEVLTHPQVDDSNGSGRDVASSSTQKVSEASVTGVLSDGNMTSSNMLAMSDKHLLLEQPLEETPSGESIPNSLQGSKVDKPEMVLQSIESKASSGESLNTREPPKVADLRCLKEIAPQHRKGSPLRSNASKVDFLSGSQKVVRNSEKETHFRTDLENSIEPQVPASGLQSLVNIFPTACPSKPGGGSLLTQSACEMPVALNGATNNAVLGKEEIKVKSNNGGNSSESVTLFNSKSLLSSENFPPLPVSQGVNGGQQGVIGGGKSVTEECQSVGKKRLDVSFSGNRS